MGNRKTATFHKLLFRQALALILLAVPALVFAQPNSDQRAQELIDRFDSRVGEVRTLVDSSRLPFAAELLQQAVSLRNQAESRLRAGQFEMALNLASRALEILSQAEAAARQGGGTQEILDKLRRNLAVQRQRLQDTRRAITEFETSMTDGAFPGQEVTIFERQNRRTLALIEEAESCCEAGSDGTSNLNADRCRELVAQARRLYEQASGLMPDSPAAVAVNPRDAENRIRDARRIVDRTETELDQIERELNAANPNLANSINQRLRNTMEQIRFANDRVVDAAFAGGSQLQAETNTGLSLLRRAAELARSALRFCENVDLSEEFERRLGVVRDLRDRIEQLLQNNTQVDFLAEYQQGVDLLGQAETEGANSNYEQGLQLLSQAGTLFNRALGILGANRTVESRLEILNRLQDQYEERRAEMVGHVGPVGVDSPCAEFLRQANQFRQQSETEEGAGNLEAAFASINQAQKILSQAATCLGVSDRSRVREVLDRLQSEYDRRAPTLSEAAGSGDHPAASLLLNEAEGLRQDSDDLESQGNFELAVQTAGRAVSLLSNVQNLLSENVTDIAAREGELLNRLQQQFDDRLARVTEIVNQNPQPGTNTSLAQAGNLRNQSDTSEGQGNLQQALVEIGQAIQLLEQVTLASIGQAGQASLGTF